MGVPTRLRDYGHGDIDIEKVIALLEMHGMVRLGENQEVTPDVVRQVLNLCV